MPLTRDQADAMIRRVTLTFDGTDATLNLTYRPNLLSRSEFRRMQEIARGDDTDDAGLAPLLGRCIVGWDFVQDDGTPFPVDDDSLSLLGYPVQIEIVRGMIAAPTPPNGQSSGASYAANRILPPIEASSSSAPNGSEERSMSPS